MIKADEINELAKAAVKSSLAHGYRDNEYPSRRIIIKTMCEIAEIVDAMKRGQFADVAKYNAANGMSKNLNFKTRYDNYTRYIKDSVQDEFADVMIYCLLAAGHFNVKFNDNDIEKAVKCASIYTESLANKDFVMRAGTAFECILSTVFNTLSMARKFVFIEEWLKCETGEDIWWYVKEKMEYNLHRPYLHGFMNDKTV